MIFRVSSTSELEVFQGSAAGFIQLLDRHLEERAYMAGQEMMVEGEEGNSVFILLSGEVP